MVYSLITSIIVILLTNSSSYAENNTLKNDTANIIVPKIVIFGSEVTMGQKVDYKDHFSSVLKKHFDTDGYKVQIFDKSQKFNSTKEALNAVDSEVISLNPDVVVVNICSDNELNPATNIDEVRYSLESILWRLFNAKINNILLIGCIATWKTEPEYRKRYEYIYPYLASKYKIRFYRHFFDGFGSIPSFLVKGSKSPSAKGMKYITKAIYPYVKIYVDNVLNRAALNNQ